MGTRRTLVHIRANDTITVEAGITLTTVASNCVITVRMLVAIVCPRCTLIDILAVDTIAFETKFTSTKRALQLTHTHTLGMRATSVAACTHARHFHPLQEGSNTMLDLALGAKARLTVGEHECINTTLCRSVHKLHGSTFAAVRRQQTQRSNRQHARSAQHKT